MKLVRRPAGVWVLAVVAAAATFSAVHGQTPAKVVQSEVTFARDVAPILQRSCQKCHRPGQMAPMSLLTYADARPWARSIKTKVASRQMPPWAIDRRVGIQKFSDDPSLSDQEIAIITKWVDAGAPQGNPSDMPKPVQFADADVWHIGTPDLVVTSPAHTVPTEAADWWGSYVVATGLTEDRYIKAVEAKPGKGMQKVVHHLLTYMVEGDESTGESLGDDSSNDSGEFLNEFAVGKAGDVFPEGSGRLLKAGSKIKFDFHYHAIGKEMTDRSQVAFVFYPKGYVPKHIQYSRQLGQPAEPLDIPSGSAFVRSDGYTRMNLPGKLTAFQPHMHTRGRKQCLELIYPDNKTEQISCADFSFAWHTVYNYATDVTPIYPAGTILHVITWHDNSIHAGNPDPRNWVGGGNRTIDEMGFAWINWYDLTQEEYKAEFEARKAKPLKMSANTAQVPQPGR